MNNTEQFLAEVKADMVARPSLDCGSCHFLGVSARLVAMVERATFALRAYSSADRVEVRRGKDSWSYDGRAIADNALAELDRIASGKGEG